MILISIDLESTGLNPETCQILEMGAVITDLTKPYRYENAPKFHCFVKPNNEVITGEYYALNMNKKILKAINEETPPYLYFYKDQVAEKFANFLWDNIIDIDLSKYNFCGKNFASFDLPFLKKLPKWDKIKYHHRMLDPGSLYFQLGDKELPNTEECCKRAGIELSKDERHNALYDADIVIQLIRKKFGV